MWEYTIKDGKWFFERSGWSSEIIGFLVSVDSPELYNQIYEIVGRDQKVNFKDPVITLMKHGHVDKVKEYYLTIVDSPLRMFSDFHYFELKPTEEHKEIVNKIISTSCLPKRFIASLIDG